VFFKTVPGSLSDPAQDDERRSFFLVFMASFALLSLANTVYGLVAQGILKPVYTLVFILSTAVVATASRSRIALLVRPVEIGLACTIIAALAIGPAREHVDSLGALPAFMLFCLYFDGRRALLASGLFSLATTAAWYGAYGHASFALADLAIVAFALFFILGFALLIARNLSRARLGSEALLLELHHRMRNSLQTLMIIGSDLGREGEAEASPGDGLVIARLLALRAVHREIARSGNIGYVRLDRALGGLSADLASLGIGSVQVVATGTLAFEKAGPLALMVAELALAKAPAASGSSWIRVWARPDEALVAVEPSRAGEGPARKAVEDWSGFRASATFQGLLAQIGGFPHEASCGPSFAFDPRVRMAGSVTPFPLAFVESVAQSRRLEGFLLGKANLGRSMLHIGRVRILALFYALALAALVLVSASSLVQGLQPRILPFGGMCITIAALVLLRMAHLRTSASLFACAFAAIMGLAAIWGTNHEHGAQLFAMHLLVLFSLYFLGKKGGAVSIGFGALVFLAWGLAFAGRQVPVASFVSLASTYMLFSLVAYFLINSQRFDLAEKDSLVLELQNRLVGYLDVLLEELRISRAGGDGAGSDQRFLSLCEAMSRAHTATTEAGSTAHVDMELALGKFLDPRVAVCVPAGGADHDEGRRLSAEKSVTVLLIVAELCGLAGSPGPRGERIRVSFESSASAASLVLVASGPPGSLPRLAAGDRALGILEARLSVSHRIVDSERYSIEFPA
jgi:hypothetical protein